MLVNQSKTTYQQRIQEDGSISKEIPGIEILAKYRDSYIKIWQPIKITRILPTRVRKRSQFRNSDEHDDLNWLHFANEPRLQKRQQVLNKQPYIPILLHTHPQQFL